MSKPWPPPPDLESLKELFATADVEGLIADDCPIDEYDPEAKHFFEQTLGYPSAKFSEAHTLPLLEELFGKQFMWSTEQKLQRRSNLEGLAQQIERFFGPTAQPQVRSNS
jgi:hypothetical protein